MPSFPTRLLAARYGSLVVAIFALNLACCSIDANLAQDAHAKCAHAQGAFASHPNTAPQLGDGWRRTARGWERLPIDGRDAARSEVPSEHVALVQAWPAAWAACLVLSVLGLAAAGAEWKEIDACLAADDQVGYDLSSAA